MKKTKIVCTIGPATNNVLVLEKMIKAGMNVARVNFSHGTHESHKLEFDNIKKARENTSEPIGIMLDTKGPEYRIGKFKDGKVFIKPNAKFTFTSKEVLGDSTIVSVTPKNIVKNLSKGDTVLVANGLVSFKVLDVKQDCVVCRCISGGELFDRKSMNFPEKLVTRQFLSSRDKDDLIFGIQNDIDMVACSFVSTKNDALSVRKFLDENGGKNIDIIAKLENQSGIDNIDDILDVADGIMIGRGDMGVELPIEKLPEVQKMIIKKCQARGKTVVTATEMLESMINNPRPTRAEVSDVANAVYDGSSAVMLSGETAVGKYPIEAVETMAKVARATEIVIDYAKRFNNLKPIENNDLDAVCLSAVKLAVGTNSKLIVASSKTGKTIKSISRFQSPIMVMGATTDKKAYYKLSICYGVIPMLVEDYPTLNQLFDNMSKLAKEQFKLKKGDNIVITGGIGDMTNTNLIKVEKIK